MSHHTPRSPRNYYVTFVTYVLKLLDYLRSENSDEFNNAQSKSSNTAERSFVSLQYASAELSSVSVGSRDNVRR